MSRCSKVMQALRDDFPPLLASLESIIDNMLRDLREHWSEVLLREMRGILRQLQIIQYKNRSIFLNMKTLENQIRSESFAIKNYVPFSKNQHFRKKI